MLWPVLRTLAHGHLTTNDLEVLHQTFSLVSEGRSEGPGAAQSIAHRTFTDVSGAPVLVDLARTGDTGWVLTLFRREEQPAAATIEAHRASFRDAVERLGLTLVQTDPPATADEVLSPVPAGTEPDSAIGAHWPLPEDDLAGLWTHLGVRADAPLEVRAIKLRELMLTPAWSDAPKALRGQAEKFLRGN